MIEIVTEPCLHNSEEAAAYLTQIRKLVRWIGICDGNMEEGSLRCDANISVRLYGTKKLGTRVEVKNLNSIKHLRHAIDIEVERLSNILERGEAVLQETRGYDADKGITFSIRTKEDAEDYRYFPEPDLAPFDFTDEFIEQIKMSLPAMPEQRVMQYMLQFGLTDYDARQLTEDKTLSDLFDELAASTDHKKQLANFLLGPIKSHLKTIDTGWESLSITKENWNQLLTLVVDGKIAFSAAAQHILPVLLVDQQATPIKIAQALNLIQDAGQEEVSEWVREVLASMPDKVDEYRKGKKGLIGLFVGEVKKISKGKADPKLSTELLTNLLNQK